MWGGVFYLTTGALLTIEDDFVATSNYAAKNGGVFSLYMGAYVKASGGTFKSNSANGKGGIFNIERDGHIHLQECVFLNSGITPAFSNADESKTVNIESDMAAQGESHSDLLEHRLANLCYKKK